MPQFPRKTSLERSCPRLGLRLGWPHGGTGTSFYWVLPTHLEDPGELSVWLKPRGSEGAGGGG